MYIQSYTDLSDEDKVLMDGLFQYKEKKEAERKIYRTIISRIKAMEENCTKEIMSLTRKKIAEKFDISPNSVRPLSDKKRQLKEKSGVQGLNLNQQKKIEKAIEVSRGHDGESNFSIALPDDRPRHINKRKQKYNPDVPVLGKVI